ncbi:oligoribonuclease [Gammaproteobacteria bacterium]|nr:oligoribonuclease [Gammaproteobacteria bacterium]
MIWAWVDLEMTGLDDADQIIEFAMVMTDSELNEVSAPVHAVLSCPDAVLDQMGEWCRNHHAKSGLTDLVRQSGLTIRDLDAAVSQQLSMLTEKGPMILAGNSIHTDRRFIVKYMPLFNQALHYRMLDVSSLKILHSQWTKDAPFDKGDSSHRALDDIYMSIEELKYYKNWMFAS